MANFKMENGKYGNLKKFRFECGYTSNRLSMEHRLFSEINNFYYWAESYSKTPEEKRLGEWEVSYDAWPKIWHTFEGFLNKPNPATWDNSIIQELLYIITRDNESESLAQILSNHQNALRLLAVKALTMGHRDSKWQIAVQLKTLSDVKHAEELLEKFVQDDDEYVSRRALITLADIGSSKTEFYCKVAWNKNVKEQEYQRMAALHALHKIQSPLLAHYLQLAKEDGREHLMFNVYLIEKEQPQ